MFIGSGSSYLYGFFDQAWKEGMTQEEAEVSCLQFVFTTCLICTTVLDHQDAIIFTAMCLSSSVMLLVYNAEISFEKISVFLLVLDETF